MKNYKTSTIRFKNPIGFKSPQLDALEEAYKIMVDAFDDFVSQNDLSNEQVEQFRLILSRVFLEKKASVFLGEKIGEISTNFSQALSDTVRQLPNRKNNFTQIFFHQQTTKISQNG